MGVVDQENLLPGETNAGQYLIGGAGDETIQGFARQISYNVGQAAQFSVSGPSAFITIYRVGHYQGAGWRRVTEIANSQTTQPDPVAIPNSNGATTCAGWSVTAAWTIPDTAVSGLYVGVVRNIARNNASWIYFIVRNDSRRADIVVALCTSTWGAAYNNFGHMGAVSSGRNVYGEGTGVGQISQRSFAVSLDRPIICRKDVVNHWDNYESAMIDWLEQNGYDVKYVASEDLDARPTAWNSSRLYISVGHDEYWSQNMRTNVENFRQKGGHCFFISGNEVFWKTRYTDNGRVMWCHKDTMPGPGAHFAGQPLDPVTWTGTWRDTRWTGCLPESVLTGTFFRMNGVTFKTPTISSATYGQLPFWRGTSMTTTSLVMTNGIGFEADEMRVTDQRKVTVLASDVVNINGSYANEDGQDYSGSGNLNPWAIVMHCRGVGQGIVVGFGTMTWAWQLSDRHRAGSPVRNVVCEQATVNLLKDLGIGPATLRSGLVNPAPVPITDYGMPAQISPQITNIFKYDGQMLVPFLVAGDELLPIHRVGPP